MSSKIDLHIHSTSSDGIFTPKEILEKVRKKKIKYFSITDHDNIDSIKLIRKENLDKINYISGVEISAYYDYYGIHILGYFIDGDTTRLESLLKKIKSNRKKRMQEILDTLKIKSDIEIKNDDLDDLMSSNNIGKKKLGSILLKYNLGKDYIEVRDKFLTGMHCKTSYRESIIDVSDAIKEAGGIVILAHPKELEKRYGVKLEDEIEKLISFGIDGIEIYHSIHTKDDIKRYYKIAKKYNLITSGGSDFHGYLNSKISLGKISKEKVFRYKKLNIIDRL